MEKNKLEKIIESLLFVHGDPVEISKLVKVTQDSREAVEKAIEDLAAFYESSDSGLRVLRAGGKVQLGTAPASGTFVEKMVKAEFQEDLSQSALEVISIVAYMGPISKGEIEAIRGVNSYYSLRNLLLRGLIEKRENPSDGRGNLYEASFDFLKSLGISNVKELPDYAILTQDEKLKSIEQISEKQ